jgi:site-specific recombinase XerD
VEALSRAEFLRLLSTPSKHATENAELLKKYFVYLRAERGASENTVASYQFDLERFCQWSTDSLVSVQRTDVQRFIADVLTRAKVAAAWPVISPAYETFTAF